MAAAMIHQLTWIKPVRGRACARFWMERRNIGALFPPIYFAERGGTFVKKQWVRWTEKSPWILWILLLLDRVEILINSTLVIRRTFDLLFQVGKISISIVKKFSSRNVKKHLNETKFASKISTSGSILCTDIPASKIPSPENTILEHPRRKETSKRRVDRAEPIRQTANLPPHHISSRTSTKIQFVENSRLLEEEGERYIYI